MLTPADRLDVLCGTAIRQFNPERDDMARGLHRLQSTLSAFMAEVDSEADKAADELQAKRDRCISAVNRMRTDIGKVFEDAAKSAEDMLNQFSNGGPPLEESPVSAPLPDIDVRPTQAGQ